MDGSATGVDDGWIDAGHAGAPADGDAAGDDDWPAGDGRPLVSAVVPTYGRRPAYLRTAVESVAAQTYDPVELVVVDDSPGAVSAWLDDRPPDGLAAVRTVRGRDHDGAAAARNAGIAVARGDVVAFLDDDDWWLPGKLERQVAAFDDGVGVVHTGLRVVDDRGTRRVSAPGTRGRVVRDLLAGVRLGPFSALAVRRGAVAAAGDVDERFPYLEDREWYLRLARHCRFERVAAPLVVRRCGDHDQLTDDFETLRDVAVPLFVRKHRSLAAAYGPGYERRLAASLSKLLANAALADGRYGEARRFATMALRNDPTDPVSGGYLAAAVGGRPAYAVARAVARAVRGGGWAGGDGDPTPDGGWAGDDGDPGEGA